VPLSSRYTIVGSCCYRTASEHEKVDGAKEMVAFTNSCAAGDIYSAGPNLDVLPSQRCATIGSCCYHTESEHENEHVPLRWLH